MRVPSEPLRFLNPEEMETIHSNALRILAEVGMRVYHQEALDFLESAGCSIDRETCRVSFPETVVQTCVDKMRSDYSTRDYPERMAIRYSHVRFRQEPFQIHSDFSVSTGGYCAFIYDLNGVRRAATVQDTRDSLRLAHQLDQITYTGLPVAGQDVPLPVRPVRMAAELVKHTDKLGGIEALNRFDIEYICRIAEVVRGGAEKLYQRPCLVGYAEAKTPLTLDEVMCVVFLEYLKRGIPQSLDTMPNAGATAPMHPSGALALGIAETLGGLVLAQSVDENACVTIDVTPGFADMRTGIFKYAGAERVSLLGARIQMISEYYGCPSGVHGGKTDSCVPDVRTGVEKGISMLTPILCGAVGIGTVGHLENAVTFSPVQLVIDNEVARYVRHCVSGFEVTDETINVDLIRRVGIGGNYLSEMETASQYREFLNLSQWSSAEPWATAWGDGEIRDWNSRAEAKVRELLERDYEPPLSPEQEQEVDNIVAHAESRLGL
jgi:trimethylamine--corrinoid protein Co-methyltransferase